MRVWCKSSHSVGACVQAKVAYVVPDVSRGAPRDLSESELVAVDRFEAWAMEHRDDLDDGARPRALLDAAAGIVRGQGIGVGVVIAEEDGKPVRWRDRPYGWKATAFIAQHLRQTNGDRAGAEAIARRLAAGHPRSGGLSGGKSTKEHAADLVNRMNSGPQTGTDMDRLDINPQDRPNVLAEIEAQYPGAYVAWRVGPRETVYGTRRHAELAGVLHVPITAPDEEMSFAWLATVLIRAIDTGPQTGAQVVNRFKRKDLQNAVLAAVQQRHPGLYVIVPQSTSAVSYRRRDAVPAGMGFLPLDASDEEVALARRANNFISAMNIQPRNATELAPHRRSEERVPVLAMIERWFPGAYVTWQRSSGTTILGRREAAESERVSYAPIAVVGDGSGSVVGGEDVRLDPQIPVVAGGSGSVVGGGAGGLRGVRSIEEQAADLVHRMDNGPQTGNTVSTLITPRSRREAVLAAVQQRHPGLYAILPVSNGASTYRRRDAVPAGMVFLPLDASADDVTLARHANNLINAMNTGPQTRSNLDLLHIRGELRTRVLAVIERWFPGAYVTWERARDAVVLGRREAAESARVSYKSIAVVVGDAGSVVRGGGGRPGPQEAESSSMAVASGSGGPVDGGSLREVAPALAVGGAGDLFDVLGGALADAGVAGRLDDLAGGAGMAGLRRGIAARLGRLSSDGEFGSELWRLTVRARLGAFVKSRPRTAAGWARLNYDQLVREAGSEEAARVRILSDHWRLIAENLEKDGISGSEWSNYLVQLNSSSPPSPALEMVILSSTARLVGVRLAVYDLRTREMALLNNGQPGGGLRGDTDQMIPTAVLVRDQDGRWHTGERHFPPQRIQQPAAEQAQAQEQALARIRHEELERERGQALQPLAARGLVLGRVADTGDCFYEAFLRTVDAAGGPVHGMTVEGLRAQLATMVETRDFHSVDPAVIQQVVGGSVHPDGVWDRIASQIRRPTNWADLGGDLAPHLAAALFGVRIEVLTPNGAIEHIGQAGPVITLFHPTNHWDATQPQPSPPRPYPLDTGGSSGHGRRGYGGYGQSGSGGSGQGGFTNVWRAQPPADMMTRGMRAVLTDHPELFATGVSPGHLPVRATGPDIVHDDHGLAWVASSRSGKDAHGNPIDPKDRACVNVTVITITPR